MPRTTTSTPATQGEWLAESRPPGPIIKLTLFFAGRSICLALSPLSSIVIPSRVALPDVHTLWPQASV